MADIKQGFEREITINPLKADQSPGLLDGIPEWSVSDETLATMVVAADGMSGKVQHAGGTGAVTLTVRGDGDLGAGVFPIVGSEEFNMLPPLGAVAFGFGVGEEQPIVPAP